MSKLDSLVEAWMNDQVHLSEVLEELARVPKLEDVHRDLLRLIAQQVLIDGEQERDPLAISVMAMSRAMSPKMIVISNPNPEGDWARGMVS